MKAAELSIIGSLDKDFIPAVRELVAYAEILLKGETFYLSVTSYTRPWVAGRRTDAQQMIEFLEKRSKLDGIKLRSDHQDGCAIHFGFRDKKDSSKYWTLEEMPSAMALLFWMIVRKAERMGFKWGGRFKPLDAKTGIGWDSEHFAIPKAAPKKPADPETPSTGDNRLYGVTK